MSLRLDFTKALRTAVPSKWRVYGYGIAPQSLEHPVIVVRQRSVKPTEGAPRAFWDTAFSVALVEPVIDPERVEDALDADIETLIEALEALDFPGLVWQEAQRVTFEDAFHGYDITVQITNTKEA